MRDLQRALVQICECEVCKDMFAVLEEQDKRVAELEEFVRMIADADLCCQPVEQEIAKELLKK
jgi:hypothetical protein